MDYGVVGSEEKQEIVCLYMFFPSEVASHYEQLHSPGYSLAHGNENNLFNIHVILMTIDPIFFSFSFTNECVPLLVFELFFIAYEMAILFSISIE